MIIDTARTSVRLGADPDEAPQQAIEAILADPAIEEASRWQMFRSIVTRRWNGGDRAAQPRVQREVVDVEAP